MPLPPKVELQWWYQYYFATDRGYAHRIIKGGVGHNLPQEAPQAFAQAVFDVDAY